MAYDNDMRGTLGRNKRKEKDARSNGPASTGMSGKPGFDGIDDDIPF